MLITLNTSTPIIYFRGDKGDYKNYRIKLKSIYSNEFLLNNEYDTISCTLTGSGNNWFALRTEPLDIKLTTQTDIEGYYECLIEGEVFGVYSQFKNVLCKVKNNYDTNSPDVEYISNNEDNEQYIYFKE